MKNRRLSFSAARATRFAGSSEALESALRFESAQEEAFQYEVRLCLLSDPASGYLVRAIDSDNEFAGYLTESEDMSDLGDEIARFCF